MKPNPLVVLKNFTVPVDMMPPGLALPRARVRAASNCRWEKTGSGARKGELRTDPKANSMAGIWGTRTLSARGTDIFGENNLRRADRDELVMSGPRHGITAEGV
jgi:hypothetical protein